MPSRPRYNLTIKNVQYSDEGEYRCQLGARTPEVAYLVVSGRWAGGKCFFITVQWSRLLGVWLDPCKCYSDLFKLWHVCITIDVFFSLFTASWLDTLQTHLCVQEWMFLTMAVSAKCCYIRVKRLCDLAERAYRTNRFKIRKITKKTNICKKEKLQHLCLQWNIL